MNRRAFAVTAAALLALGGASAPRERRDAAVLAGEQADHRVGLAERGRAEQHRVGEGRQAETMPRDPGPRLTVRLRARYAIS